MSKEQAPATTIAEPDLDRFRLRNFLARLAQQGELETRPEPVPLAAIAAALDGERKAVWFQQAGPERASLCGNVLASRARMAQAFGVEPRDLLGEILKRLKNKPEIVEIPREAAPVQQVVLTGDEVDLTKLPIHLQHGRDGGPYISAAIDFAFDKNSGLNNVGLRRLMLRGKRETGIDLVAPSDLRDILLATLARGEKLPLSIVVGAHPVDYFAATMRAPVDELGLMASLRGAPLAVVKCVTNDLRVPADAEYVLEGYLDAKGYAEPEGPYGEFLGYYGGVKTNPVFRVTAITRRRDAVFETVTISGRTMNRTDTAQLCALRTEVLAWRALETAVREPLAVYAPAATGGTYNLRVSLRQRVPGEARNAIAALFASLANIKNVFVVDPDIDIFSDEQMEWALGTRFQPQRDLVVVGGFRTAPLDPSLDPGARTGSKAGFDLTMGFGSAGLELAVPEVPRYQGPRFVSLRAALLDGPKSFEQLMAALGSDDGREIVRALEELSAGGELSRDPKDGTYLLRLKA
jgi:2,5-furandicarboxylate decarboxylase 1